MLDYSPLVSDDASLIEQLLLVFDVLGAALSLVDVCELADVALDSWLPLAIVDDVPLSEVP